MKRVITLAILACCLLCFGQGLVLNRFFNQTADAGGGGGGADVAWRSTSHVAGTGLNATPSEPAGTAQNDILIAIFGVSAAGTPGLPAGWTVITNGTEAIDGQFDYIIGVIRRGASAPNLTFTTGTSQYREVYIHAISGASTAGNAIDVIEVAARATGNGTGGVDPPQVTTVNDNALIVIAGLCWAGSGGGGWGAPANYTIRGDNTAGNSIANATRSAGLISPAGAENPAIFTNPAGIQGFIGITLGVSD